MGIALRNQVKNRPILTAGLQKIYQCDKAMAVQESNEKSAFKSSPQQQAIM